MKTLRALECCKCGSTDIATAFHKSGYNCSYRYKTNPRLADVDPNKELSDGEHLHYHCRNCSYEWVGETGADDFIMEEISEIDKTLQYCIRPAIEGIPSCEVRALTELFRELRTHKEGDIVSEKLYKLHLRNLANKGKNKKEL